MSLVEVSAAMTVMFIAMLALTSTSLVVHSADQAEKERRLALNGMTAAVERLQARSAAAIDSDLGWGTAVTEAYAAGGAPGAGFDVAGLEPWIDGSPIGSIQIITDETLSDEDIDSALGMPRDLDADGLVVNGDVTNNAEILPVVVRVRWRGSAGNRELVQGCWIARM